MSSARSRSGDGITKMYTCTYKRKVRRLRQKPAWRNKPKGLFERRLQNFGADSCNQPTYRRTERTSLNGVSLPTGGAQNLGGRRMFSNGKYQHQVLDRIGSLGHAGSHTRATANSKMDRPPPLWPPVPSSKSAARKNTCGERIPKPWRRRRRRGKAPTLVAF